MYMYIYSNYITLLHIIFIMVMVAINIIILHTFPSDKKNPNILFEQQCYSQKEPTNNTNVNYIPVRVNFQIVQN